MNDPFRLKLHEKLINVLGSENVYYQPPESLKLTYPAIVYFLQQIPAKYADNGVYILTRTYQVNLITKEPDPEAMYKMLELPKCAFANRYVSDGLNHYTYTVKE